MTDFRNAKFDPLPLKIEDEANISTPYAIFSEADALLRYWANTPKSQAYEIRFFNCPTFRIGDPNDEGFYSDGISSVNSSVYNCINFPDLEFGGFFEIHGLNLNTGEENRKGFASNQYSPKQNLGSLRHFIFFMRDATFECFAEQYEENGLQPISILEEAHAEFT